MVEKPGEKREMRRARVLEEEEDFWKFMQCTSSERNMDDYDVFGIILSALVSK